jgi:hypothetical protein
VSAGSGLASGMWVSMQWSRLGRRPVRAGLDGIARTFDAAALPAWRANSEQLVRTFSVNMLDFDGRWRYGSTKVSRRAIFVTVGKGTW